MFESPYILSHNKDWITGLFLFIFLLLAGLKYLYQERILYSGIHFFSKNHISINFNKDNHKIFNVFQSALFLIQVIILSLLLYFASLHYNLNIIIFNLHLFLSIFFSITIYFVFKYFIGSFLSYVFNLKKSVERFINFKISYLHNLILWLIPFLIIQNYIENYKTITLYITLIIFFCLLALRYSLLLHHNKKLIFSNLFYFILYLCALEIAPIIIIIKLII